MSPYIDLIVNFSDTPRISKPKSAPLAQSPLSVATQSLRSIGIFSTPSSSASSTDDVSKISDDSEMYEPPLEPVEAMHTLLPEVLAIGSLPMQQSRLKPTSSSRVSEPKSLSSNSLRPILTLLTRRDRSGRMVVSQTEMLAHVFLSLLHDSSLHNTACVDLLMTLFDVLRTPVSRSSQAFGGSGSKREKRNDDMVVITVEPSLCILLLKLLVADDRLQHVAQLIQLRYFSESADFAMVMLELADTITLSDMYSSEKGDRAVDVSIDNICGDSKLHNEGGSDAAVAVYSLRLAGLEMLWRLQERRVVVRWLLSHGRIGDAMALCLRDSKGQWQSHLEPPSAVPGVEFFLATVDMLKSIPAGKDGKKVELMYTVCRFLAEWD
eukprot:CAMPEP_0182435552 /NCGR_PEP_ID=MMETSP1167-20130531/76356_1 /TAXON_ID=2988 /ORGANISM="Mallomonas Sp, Strain CCMP3275" /LENGTH=379 /DNA_ID=CAMNT_0024626733 /DNA_START=55 /DNA_END=1191 /DNA_ORIENTATION=+